MAVAMTNDAPKAAPVAIHHEGRRARAAHTRQTMSAITAAVAQTRIMLSGNSTLLRVA